MTPRAGNAPVLMVRSRSGTRPPSMVFCAMKNPHEARPHPPGLTKTAISAISTLRPDPNLAPEQALGSLPPSPPELELPERIGRYQILRLLGRGSFGQVFLARDTELDRMVAVKVAHSNLIRKPADAESYLAEARILASLDHPHIVAVHDVGRAPDGRPFVVSQYIEGRDLAATMHSVRPSLGQSVEWVAAIAEALHHAHRHGLVHRDVKPANILLDSGGKPYLVDFGLALQEEQFGHVSAFAGSPAYMSPEQARSESHRVDGRSDIFSLGVVFYELLTGRRPFSGQTTEELLEHIAVTEARPPRQVNDQIPKELERICLQALAKRTSERYTTALDLAEDLRNFLTDTSASLQAEHPPSFPLTRSVASSARSLSLASLAGAVLPKIVPKGLRSFDEHDADFFLELLPGPRDRDGLPEAIRFWKSRIEETTPDRAFAVGLMYGPSGCGKSSLVKAGLLPRLASTVTIVYVEATAAETEARLVKA